MKKILSKLYTPTKLTTGDCNHLFRKSGLQREQWGEGWLALEAEYRSAGILPEDTAVGILRRIATLARNQEALRALHAANALAEAV